MIIQRYILRELTVTFALSFAAVVSVCTVAMMFQTLRSYEGMSLAFVVRLAPVALSQMSPWAMLVSACLTATLVYGRLAADNEIDAIRTSGVHVSRILVPVMLLGLLLSALAYVTYGELAPRARYARRSLIKETLMLILRHPPSGRQTELKVGARNRLSYAQGGEARLDRPALLTLEKGRAHFLWFAREGRLMVPEEGAPAIVLVDGAGIQFETGGEYGAPARIRNEIHFKSEQSVEFELEDIYKRRRGPEDMPTRELRAYTAVTTALARVEKAEDGPKRAAEALTEYHGRIAKSLAPFVLVLLCTPIGVMVKKGSRLAGIGVALPPLLLYIVLIMFGEGLATKQIMAPEIATYGPVALLAAAAAVLLFRICRK
jgi:lipopolysaccharide export LptBFGC system permease protein LptF